MSNDHVKQILEGSDMATARLISWLEDEDERATSIMEEIYSRTGKAYIIGITGAPGGGKSTLTDKLTRALRKEDSPWESWPSILRVLSRGERSWGTGFE